MVVVSIPRATSLGFSGLRWSVEPSSPGERSYKGSQFSSTNALNQFGPNRFLALAHLDYPQSHCLHPVLMMPFYKFKTNTSCPIPRLWEG